MLYHSHSACAAVKRIVSNEARGAGHDVSMMWCGPNQYN